MNLNCNYKSTILKALLLLCLTSCEPSTKYNKIVVNKSSHDLQLIIKNTSSEVELNTILRSYHSYVIIDEERRNAPYDDYKNCSNDNYQISVVHPFDSIELEITSCMEWDYWEDSKRRGLDNKVMCEYVILDALFE